MQSTGGARGSTLIEAVVAIAILTTGVLSLCGLTSVAVRTITFTRERTMAAVLASQKLENLSAAPRAPSASSPGAESQGETDAVEYLDAVGRVVGTGTAARNVVYVRRWAISPLRADAALKVIRVTVSPCRHVSENAPGCGAAATTVRLATIRTGAMW